MPQRHTPCDLTHPVCRSTASTTWCNNIPMLLFVFCVVVLSTGGERQLNA